MNLIYMKTKPNFILIIMENNKCNNISKVLDSHFNIQSLFDRPFVPFGSDVAFQHFPSLCSP